MRKSGTDVVLWTAAVLTLTLGAGAALGQAPPAPLPTGEAVLAKYVVAAGGGAAFDALKSRITRARMELAGTGVVIMITTYAAAPASVYSVAESDATGRIESGASDGVAWEISTARGAVLKDGAERDEALKVALFDRLAHWKEHLKSVECTGTADVNGKPAYRVAATPRSGSPETLFFDVDSGLLVRTEMTVVAAAGPVSLTADPGDYRMVDGIMMAFSSRMTVMGQERVVTIDHVEHNAAMPADRFALPPAIRALAKK